MISDSQGRLQNRRPVSVIDIGSNSIRLVIYEGIARSPTVLFNEKMLAGLGRGIVATGKLDPEAVVLAVEELRRFRALSEQAKAESLHVIATAAARDAENGPDFIERAERILGQPIHVLTGGEEAEYSALGVTSSIYGADGIVGDLGGGSLELVDVHEEMIGARESLPLGGLRLQDMAKGSVEEAARISREALSEIGFLKEAEGRAFYAVGGTWRNLARLHMLTTNYPLNVMHQYVMQIDTLIPFLQQVMQGSVSKIKGIESVSKNRRALLPYGAAVMLEIIELMKPSEIVISAHGVREGYLYTLLPIDQQHDDPLVSAAEELAVLRARSVQHGYELVKWTADTLAVLGVGESLQDERLRDAACLVADIGWRAHPEYRGVQSLNVIAHASFISIDHPGRAFLALSSLFRHEGVMKDGYAPELAAIAGPHYLERARLLAAMLRVIYLLSASMPGVIPRLKWVKQDDGRLALVLPNDLKNLRGERPDGRMQQLSKISGKNLVLIAEE